MTPETRLGGETSRVATTAVPPRASRYPCFDGLRAIAALTVVGVHTSFASGFTIKNHIFGRYTSRLEIGVEVFFVISGFLLYRQFAAAHFSDRPPPAARQFWIRRLKRIIPAYWAAFLVISYVLHADTIRHTWDAPFIYLGFAQIYFPHYIISGVDQAWSLGTEMTFYLTIPLYAAAVAARSRSPRMQLRAELLGLAGLTAVSFAYRIPVLLAHGQLADVMPNWLPGYLDQFALGMLLAVVSAYLATTGSGAHARLSGALGHPATPWVCWSLAAVSFWAVSNIGLPLNPLQASAVGPSLLRQTLYGTFAFLLVLPAVFGPQDRGAVRRMLRWRPLVEVGVVSYGVYLWHEAWMRVFLSWFGGRLFVYPWAGMLAVVTALAVATAVVSYRLVERPFLRSGRPAAPGGSSRIFPPEWRTSRRPRPLIGTRT